MITLDASVVIAHLQPRDPHHERATNLLRENVGRQLRIHPLNLAEVLVGAVAVGRGHELLADLEGIGIRPAEVDLGEPLRLAALRVETGLKLPDCCALDCAVTHRTALATFDHRLAAAARGRHLRVEPE